MATQIQFRRGSKAQHDTFTGATGEVTVDTTNISIHVHDGTTPGGVEAARADLANHSNVGVLTATTFSGDVSSSGLSTFSNVLVGSAVTINSSGINASGIITATTLIGSTINATTGNFTTGNIFTGIVTTLNSTDANITNLNVSGVTTSTGGFVGNLTGIAATATDAVQLQTARTFQITGDVLSSPISFNGTSNVGLAVTIQANSVALGSDTTGDYVQSITGTSNEISVTSGTGEGSTPQIGLPDDVTIGQDLVVSRDVQINRNLNVNGNITIGGTSTTLLSQELKISDPDIVLGFRTDANNNENSNDTTANHGGVAVASTEGTPLISLYDVGIGETNPSTYKKFMWFKSGTFSGLGTDTWISNYAIGIGSTQVPNGVRLASGTVQFTENDLSAVRNINSSGIVTASSFVKTGGTSSEFLKADGTVDSSVYITSVDLVSDTSPQLGGNLDLNSKDIIGTGNLNITGIITASTFGGGAFKNYSETVYAFGNTGATPSLALVNGNFVTATLNDNATFTFDLTGCPSGNFNFSLVLANDATPSRTITWPASVKWPNATVPTRTTTANKIDIYTFFTYDSGTTWWGNLSLYNFS